MPGASAESCVGGEGGGRISDCDGLLIILDCKLLLPQSTFEVISTPIESCGLLPTKASNASVSAGAVDKSVASLDPRKPV